VSVARARWATIRALVPAGHGPVIDVGADHGHVAAGLPGAMATERAPGRMGRPDVAWVVADGLAPFRRVGVAIIAGMGAHTIARILSAGPRPQIAVVHAPDDPPTLRELLASAGWRIDDERAVPEGPRLAEIIRVVPGAEPATGPALRWGPKLADTPRLRAHYRRQRDRLQAIAAAVADRDSPRHARLTEDVDWLTRRLGQPPAT